MYDVLITLVLEVACSRFEPGNRLLSDVTLLCKIFNFFFTVFVGKSTFLLLTLLFLPWALRLATVFAGVRGSYRGANKSLARPRRKQATATEDFDVHISYL
jgi:hypothetical protein